MDMAGLFILSWKFPDKATAWEETQEGAQRRLDLACQRPGHPWLAGSLEVCVTSGTHQNSLDR